jgi:ADP-ribose pyrophosphatase
MLMAETATPERDVEVLEKTTPYRGFFRMDVYRLRHRKFDGGWTQELSREVFERGHAVAVLPYDPERDRVILIEQFRIGAYAAGLDAWLLETVAGVIEESESAQDVARREAHEEAGCDITDLVPIAEIMLSPGGCSETLAVYCGRVDSRGAGGIHGLAHEGEDIRVLVLPPEEALARVMATRGANANAIIPLQWLLLNRRELQQRWLP